MIMDILKMVSGKDVDQVYGQDVFYTNIREIGDRVKLE